MPTPDELKPQLKEMIVEKLFLQVDPQSIGDEQSLMDEYGVDSVMLFEIVVGLEEKFNVTLEDDEFDIETFKNVQSIAEFVAKKLNSE